MWNERKTTVKQWKTFEGINRHLQALAGIGSGLNRFVLGLECDIFSICGDYFRNHLFILAGSFSAKIPSEI